MVGGPARFASAVVLATVEDVVLNQRLHYWLHHLLVDEACLVAGQLVQQGTCGTVFFEESPRARPCFSSLERWEYGRAWFAPLMSVGPPPS